MNRVILFRTVPVAALAMLSACSAVREAYNALPGVLKVQQQLVATFGYNNIRVMVLNGRYLTIGVVNSPWTDLPAAAKKAKALEIAQVAYRNYESKAALQGIQVAFVVHKEYLLGFFTYDNASDAFSFVAAEFESAPPVPL